jgi:hypothetical protein
MDFLKNLFKRGRIGFITREIVNHDDSKSMLFYEVEEIKKGERYSKVKILSVSGYEIPTILDTNIIKWLV